MRQWHCFVGGQQYGPLGEDVLRSWIAEGRVRPTDLVWSEGMAQWAPAASVPGLCPAGIPGCMPVVSMSGVQPPPGTGCLTPNRDLMAQAREILRGHWSDAVVFALVYCVLVIGIQIVPYVGGCIAMVLGGAFELGMVCFFIAFARRGPHSLDMLFRGFKNFGNALGAYLLRAIFVFGWLLAAALPGAIIGVLAGVTTQNPRIGLAFGLPLGLIPAIIAAWIAQLGYSLTFYLLADEPGLGPVEPIMQSWRMMRGRKAKLFCLCLRFIGWGLLCILSCGIGFLWLIPYYQVSMARFYDDLRAPGAMAAQPAATTLAPASPQSGTPPPAQPL